MKAKKQKPKPAPKPVPKPDRGDWVSDVVAAT